LLIRKFHPLSPLKGERTGEGVSTHQVTPSPQPSPSREREFSDGHYLSNSVASFEIPSKLKSSNPMVPFMAHEHIQNSLKPLTFQEKFFTLVVIPIKDI
jgi:hypothetical protein